MAGSPKACLFCGRTGQKLTREHVYPRWLAKSLNITGGITFSKDDGLLRSVTELDVQVREVCSDCNNGWLHDLERAFRAVMHWPLNGFGPLAMPKSVQLVVALWATKQWLLIERSLAYLRGGETPMYAGPEVFGWLREKSEPPSTFQVWIGAMDRESVRAAATISFVGTHLVGVEEPPVGIAGVFTIGCVLFLVYAPYEGVPPTAGFYRLGIGKRLGDHLVQIWPHQSEEVRWPPPGILQRSDLDLLWPSGFRIPAKVPPTPEQPA